MKGVLECEKPRHEANTNIKYANITKPALVRVNRSEIKSNKNDEMLRESQQRLNNQFEIISEKIESQNAVIRNRAFYN